MKRKLTKPRLKTISQTRVKIMPFWSEIITILVAEHQYSDARIAKAINVPVGMVKRLADPASSCPSYEVFDRLVQLYRAVRT